MQKYYCNLPLFVLFFWLPLGCSHALNPVSIGNICNVVIPASALALSAYHRDYYGGQQALASLLVSQSIVFVTKKQIKVTRPNGTNNLSVLSGHTALSFMGAAYLEQRYGWQYSVIPYILAAYTGYSRVYAKEHRWLEVIGGAAVGQVTTYFFTKPLTTEHDTANKFRVVPIMQTNIYSNNMQVTAQALGLKLIFTW